MTLELMPNNPLSDVLITHLRELHQHLQPTAAPNPLNQFSMKIAHCFLHAYLSDATGIKKNAYASALLSVQSARQVLLNPSQAEFFPPLQQDLLLQDLNQLLLILEHTLSDLETGTKRRRFSDN